MPNRPLRSDPVGRFCVLLIALGVTLAGLLTAPAAHADDIVVPGPRARVAPRPKAPKPKGTTKTLVVQLYWNGTTPTDRTAEIARTDLTATNAWYRTVSHGKYGVSGTVTRPLGVPAMSCGTSHHLTTRYLKAATKAAKRAGYQPQHYRRLALELPCPTTSVSGRGQMPGRVVWLWQDPTPPPLHAPPAPAGATVTTAVTSSTWFTFQDWTYTWSDGFHATATSYEQFRDPVQLPAHEMGHNLGLDHAHLLQCRKAGRPTSFGGFCATIEYGDIYDTMGGRYVAGSFSAPSLKRLHWLPGKVRHVKKRGTVTLAPLEGTGGTQAATVRGKHGRTYWIEYRTRTGVDAPFDPAQLGVLIRYTKPHSTATWLIDALPGSSRPRDLAHHLVGLSDPEQAQLLPGHSLTTPEGITITTVSQGGGAAVVTIGRAHHGKHHGKHRHHKHGHHPQRHHHKHRQH